MKFQFEINDDELFDEYGIDEDFVQPLKNVIQDKVIMTIVRKLYYDNFDNREHWCGAINSEISNVIKENRDNIVSAVIDKVSNTILKKKEIVSITPKASELARIDKDNEKYFMELIDKAISKKFNG